MQYVRPFDLDAPAASGDEWLVAPDEAAECSIRIGRAPRDNRSLSPSANERFLFVMRGKLRLEDGHRERALTGEMIFIPAHASAAIDADDGSVWLDVEAPLPAGKPSLSSDAKIVKLDHSKFEGHGFAWQNMIDRKMGAQSLRLNVVRVQSGTGSPDYHIHNFSQYYLIQSGVMTIDIGHKRFEAGANTLVYLPEGVVHRNFNASASMEQHMSLLIPEPGEGDIFDYSVTIHDHEAQFIKEPPAMRLQPQDA